MASFTCCISGLVISCDHFPIYLGTESKTCHPIFHAPQKKLFSFARKWAAHELTETDSYLLFLALLKSTDRVYFRLPAIHTERTAQIVANNMEQLMIAVSRMNSVGTPETVFPPIAITADSRSLDSARYWIEAWMENYEEFKKGYSFASSIKKLSIREAALERMIKSPHRDTSSYAEILAEWAADAANFPVYPTLVDGINIPLCDYWKKVITAAAKREYFTVPKIELLDVIEHCENNIEPGSIHFHKLMEVLKDTRAYLEGFLGEINSPKQTNRHNRLELWNFAPDAPRNDGSSISGNDDVFTENIQAIINSAPAKEPIRSEFTSSLEYIKAKIKYSTAQAAIKSMSEAGMTAIQTGRRASDTDKVIDTSVQSNQEGGNDGLGF
jgi:hypothetical protein